MSFWLNALWILVVASPLLLALLVGILWYQAEQKDL